ncbi:hypothetical protein KR50_12870 [Jeotgalibacillus campisalis]|uniref:Uncharacterized protein n=1 Tax=Jeotgalibacillus campisalis TaxID=220754 RepID=A0A0C2VIJ2_9BACL|nr:hypothetical protein KR50_12870 [Jeotgalibacillus campisalis]
MQTDKIDKDILKEYIANDNGEGRNDELAAQASFKNTLTVN